MQLLLEEDGTEIEDDEYLFSLPDNTLMVLIYDGDRYFQDTTFRIVDTVQLGLSVCHSVYLYVTMCVIFVNRSFESPFPYQLLFFISTRPLG